MCFILLSAYVASCYNELALYNSIMCTSTIARLEFVPSSLLLSVFGNALRQHLVCFHLQSRPTLPTVFNCALKPKEEGNHHATK